MKRTLLFTIIVLVIPSIVSFTNNKEDQNGIAVVELFTSQGCSSCPAADKILSDFSDNEGIIALSFHVSYWNYLGWKDPYSNEQYTERQRAYGQKLSLRTIYTPQMIVNGLTEFVGSNRSTATAAIAKGLKQNVHHTININTATLSGNTIDVEYSVAGALDNTVMNIALVERHVENYVPRGENSHKTLKHDNVVRVFKTVDIKSKGIVHLALPDGFDKTKSSLILYAQNKETYKITGASKKIL